MNDGCGNGNTDGNYPSDCELTQGLLEKARERNRPVERSDAWKAVLPRAKEVKLLLLSRTNLALDFFGNQTGYLMFIYHFYNSISRLKQQSQKRGEKIFTFFYFFS